MSPPLANKGLLQALEPRLFVRSRATARVACPDCRRSVTAHDRAGCPLRRHCWGDAPVGRQRPVKFREVEP